MAEFQPNTRYHIDPTSEIIITGEEFITIQNTLTRVLSSPIYQEQLAIANTVASIGMMHEIVSKKLKDLVETGGAQPVEESSNNIPLGPQDNDMHTMD